jgi:hypothetical protein
VFLVFLPVLVAVFANLSYLLSRQVSIFFYVHHRLQLLLGLCRHCSQLLMKSLP